MGGHRVQSTDILNQQILDLELAISQLKKAEEKFLEAKVIAKS